MALLNSRNRLIYFRVSEEELSRFRALAEVKGARSLSDLMRDALERLDRSNAPLEEAPADLHEEICSIRQSISEVNTRLADLTKTLTSERVSDGLRFEKQEKNS